MQIVVASNPAARFGRSVEVGSRAVEVLRDAGHDVDHVTAANFEALLRAARRAAVHADALVVVGGDGMVHLGVNAVGGTSVPLAVVPAGSGNDFATAIGMFGQHGSDTSGTRGIERSLRELATLVEGEPQRADLIRIRHAGGEVFAAGIVSVGFDADVNVRSFRLTKVPSRIRYEVAILQTLANLQHRDFSVRIDGGPTRQLHTVIAAIANNRTLGGGIPIAPNASMTDGRLTGVFADPLSMPSFLKLLPKALRGKHLGDRRVHTEHFESIEISAASDVIACADGEIIGALPLVCSVAPGALRVFGTPT